MNDLVMAAAEAEEPPPRKRGRRLLLLALPLVAAGLGFGSGYAGLWSPLALLSGPAREAGPEIVFVDLPPIALTLPDTNPRMLHLVVKIETVAANRAVVEEMTPRLIDSFNTFLTGIAPAAFDRRGILEIVREELGNRARLALGEGVAAEVLIQEFAIR